jgi:hypothetical protein
MKNENYQQMFEMLLKTDGKLLKGFSNFHNYSLGNQYWAMWQMMGRGLEISPIATFKKWQSLNRQVKKGSKAIALLMPVTIKDKVTDEKKTIFVAKNNWFAMSQTEGEDVQFPEIGFDFDKALENLKITKENFQMTNGNVLGYAKQRVVAINPVGERPELILFHEIGHILLGHTEGTSEFVDTVTNQKNLKEVEAEGVALCCTLALGLTGSEYCVGYIKNWLKSEEIPADSIKKIFRVANEILRAGQEKPAQEVDKA